MFDGRTGAKKISFAGKRAAPVDVLAVAAAERAAREEERKKHAAAKQLQALVRGRQSRAATAAAHLSQAYKRLDDANTLAAVMRARDASFALPLDPLLAAVRPLVFFRAVAAAGSGGGGGASEARLASALDLVAPSYAKHAAVCSGGAAVTLARLAGAALGALASRVARAALAEAAGAREVVEAAQDPPFMQLASGVTRLLTDVVAARGSSDAAGGAAAFLAALGASSKAADFVAAWSCLPASAGSETVLLSGEARAAGQAVVAALATAAAAASAASAPSAGAEAAAALTLTCLAAMPAAATGLADPSSRLHQAVVAHRETLLRLLQAVPSVVTTPRATSRLLATSTGAARLMPPLVAALQAVLVSPDAAEAQDALVGAAAAALHALLQRLPLALLATNNKTLLLPRYEPAGAESAANEAIAASPDSAIQRNLAKAVAARQEALASAAASQRGKGPLGSLADAVTAGCAAPNWGGKLHLPPGLLEAEALCLDGAATGAAAAPAPAASPVGGVSALTPLTSSSLAALSRYGLAASASSSSSSNVFSSGFGGKLPGVSASPLSPVAKAPPKAASGGAASSPSSLLKLTRFSPALATVAAAQALAEDAAAASSSSSTSPWLAALQWLASPTFAAWAWPAAQQPATLLALSSFFSTLGRYLGLVRRLGGPRTLTASAPALSVALPAGGGAAGEPPLMRLWQAAAATLAEAAPTTAAATEPLRNAALLCALDPATAGGVAFALEALTLALQCAGAAPAAASGDALLGMPLPRTELQRLAGTTKGILFRLAWADGVALAAPLSQRPSAALHLLAAAAGAFNALYEVHHSRVRLAANEEEWLWPGVSAADLTAEVVLGLGEDDAPDNAMAAVTVGDGAASSTSGGMPDDEAAEAAAAAATGGGAGSAPYAPATGAVPGGGLKPKLRQWRLQLVLTSFPQVIPFRSRAALFAALRERDQAAIESALPLDLMVRVRRGHLVEDAFKAFQAIEEQYGGSGSGLSPFKTRFRISFINRDGLMEAGIDGGGLTKEFIDSLMKEAFNVGLGFFDESKEHLLFPSPQVPAEASAVAAPAGAASTSLAALAAAVYPPGVAGLLAAAADAGAGGSGGGGGAGGRGGGGGGGAAPPRAPHAQPLFADEEEDEEGSDDEDGGGGGGLQTGLLGARAGYGGFRLPWGAGFGGGRGLFGGLGGGFGIPRFAAPAQPQPPPRRAPAPLPSTPSARLASQAAAYYRFLGRLLGKALYEGFLVEPRFAAFFIKKLQGRANSVDDLASYDAELARGLARLRTCTATDLEAAGLTFETTDARGRSVPLLPGGETMPVTPSNVESYIALVADHRLNTQVGPSATAFLAGFRELVPLSWLRVFQPSELATLISGAEGDEHDAGIDWDDLRAHTHYSGGYADSQPYIGVFWEVVKSLAPADQRALLRFVTSCSRPPLLGFRSLNPAFGISRVADASRLPTAGTCANLLKLPMYGDAETLREKLLYAIRSGAGFELS